MKACVLPAAMEAEVGVTAMEVSVGAVTVRAAELLVIPARLAVIVDAPAATPVATPAVAPPETMVAAAVFEDAQVTVEVMFWVLVLL